MASSNLVAPVLLRAATTTAPTLLRAATPALLRTVRPNRVLPPLARSSRPLTTLRSPLTTSTARRLFSTTSPRRSDDENPLNAERESDQVDVVIVGGGPSGLSAAIRFKQLANEAGNEDLRVVLLEKAGDMGNHILSGAVIQPDAINELLPDWLSEENENRFDGATAVTSEKMRFLTSKAAIWIPEPPQMKNHGNYIVSLNQLTKWMSERAEELGVEVYPGFAASEVLYDDNGAVKGVATNDLGIGRDGKPKGNFERGMEFHARVTMLAEGCHGSLTKQVSKKFDLRKDSCPQTYGLGIKEVWEVKPENFNKGHVAHSMGWPLPLNTYGGAFMYHFGENKVALGLVVGLDYPNPWLSPYQEFQRMKHHPFFAKTLEGGKCISYGARALNEGGFQSIPKCVFPGGTLIGDTAGFLNVPKVKGTHSAMRSGMLAAESAFNAITAEPESDKPIVLSEYEQKLKDSSIWKELKEVRNMRPSFNSPLSFFGGLAYSGLTAYVLKGKEPWTFKHQHPDWAATKTADSMKKIEYPKPDGVLSFDILTSVSRTGTNHEEDQPVHLRVADWDKHAEKEWPRFKGLENRFCPAGVYEYVPDETKKEGVRFQINSQNCIHCKTCDIKAPSQDINWTTPQGGEGPKYFMT
ncbi:electron transfer flavo protein-ubiquinone oxidoreductase [Ascobolus immersus RN42]|uniref:Electron transfer flavoprotein-ubiquinone oxidoreductase n=1 Tax=Ascobolus immersus RN42 TaxID=1160509 RepID=A0A3N4IMG5_ASCIM|nr:electron transfer flavo protein-ubiquinone oxidoreductase [Ascobolus immersus RN42]